MTRTEQIEAAKSFTERNKDSHRIFLEDGYIEASAKGLYSSILEYRSTRMDRLAGLQLDTYSQEYSAKRIWAIDQNGIATTDFT